ncbi:kinesin-like protein KIF20B [Salmo trutta]|uniref:Kinesin family member 20Bb n=1 Tax=Salmo trutta TaxID=8032 RepID=A0A674AZN3_SALTR|nr:kinesin-like protein KIF20B [Salmo trutta]XP_029620352.1 kinesin-like protein KIF20B [Salmo trutta]XP_029620353.1 kinesin-like protein KIF20B [Salmo trutta]
MDTCLDKKPERVGPIVVEDLRKDLFADFSAIASALPQDSVFEKEHLRVYLRIRPFTTVENESGESQECVSMEPPDTVLLRAPRSSLSTRRQTSHSDGDKPVTQTTQRFQFSQVYGPDTTQRQIFDGTVKRLVRDVLEGGNSIVFTYGVTNAGKTFTFLGPESDGGILPRSLNVIFNSIEGRVYAQNNIKPHRCRDFTRLTKDQQDEDSTNKRNLMRLSKESDFLKSTMSSSCRSTILEGSSLSDISDQGEEDSFCLDVDSHTKYSVWVSFCEIYNENIYDLLEPIPNGSHRRTVLRLSQDIKGNTFVKDLKWVQVNNSEEAYKVLKIGKKNQSFSCTKLNNVSSRSHSIFSIRILRIEDVGIPRVHTISELSLCDLAGSERCAKTQNKGVQLKEAGNINTSLLTLGKCINALRLNQQAKFQQHVPFRESKLTHYLQGFFCGRGKACMIVNINQCASMYDETHNVLKFSAIAQKVVVLNIKPVPAIAPKRSARDVSLIINNAGRKNLWSRRESSMVAWETTLEDVQEDGDEEEDDYEEEESCDESMAEETILEAGEEDKTVLEDFNGQFALVEELREKLLKEEAEKLALESHIREEVTIEFMELFSKMESDYNERLAKEREIIEDRADKRLEILKNLVSKSVSKCASVTGDEEMTKEDKVELLEGIIDAMRDDLARIRRDAEAAQTCLVDLPESPGTVASLRKQVDDLSEELLKTQQQLNLKTNEMDKMSMELKQLCGQLEDVKENLESKTRTFEALMEICHEKDDVITKLQEAIDQNSEAATRDTALVDSIKEEILSLKRNCKCMSRDGSSAEEGRNRHADVLENLDDQPALKKGSLEDERVILAGELEKLQAECRQKDMTISQLKEEHEATVQNLETVKGEMERKNEDSDELKREKVSFEQTLQKLTDDLEEQTGDCEAVMASLEKERKETARLSKDNKALVNGIFQLQQTSQKAESSVKTLQTELIEQTERSANLLEELETARALLKVLEDKSNEKSQTIESLTLETERLRKEVEELKVSSVQRNNSKFHDTIDAMKRECESMVEQLLQKSQWIADLEQELNQVREQLSGQEELCSQLRHELETLRSEAQFNLQDYELEKGAYNEITKSYSDLEQMAGHLKERIVGLEVQVQASGGSSERVVELEKQLAEREAQCGALQARQEEAQRNLAQVEESRINKSKEKLIEDMRLALTEQERTQTEQEQILEAKVKEIEALSQELMSLKDSCLPKNVNSAKFSHVINCPGENVKQERQRTEERLKLVNEQHAAENQKCLEERAILMEGADGPEQESQCPAPDLMRECQKELCCSTLQTKEVKLSKQPSEKEEESGSVVEALKLEMQERNAEKERKLRELQDHSNFQTQEVLDSPQVSTDGRRELCFPKLESQFTPLYPNKLNVRRQGENKSVNIKITRSARKRESKEMEKDPVESENKKNIKLRVNNRVNMQSPTVLGVKTDQNKQQTPASLKAKKDGTLQKIGDFIQSSPTLLGGEAKTIMGIVNGRSTKREKATSVKPKRTKRKLYKTEISSPLDIPSHPIIGLDQDEKESDHLIIRRQLRSRTARK